MTSNDKYFNNEPLLMNSNPPKKHNWLSPFITAISNFSVQYNFQAISVVLIVMSQTVCTASDADCKSGDQAAWVHGTATAGVFIGAIIGQLMMGYAGDVLGRTKAMTLTLSIATIAAALSAVAPQGSPDAIYSLIIVCRVFLGIGLGGVYPLSATKAAEDGAGHGKQVNATKAAVAFFWQTPGAMGPWFVAYLLTFNDSMSADTKWRFLLGLGAIPAGFVVLLSVIESYSHPPEIPSHIVDASESSHNSVQSDDLVIMARNKKSGGESNEDLNVWELLKSREIQMKLVATGGGWFLYDVAYCKYLTDLKACR
jgi:PHS family inorganic phosphate transporter-like MFS transporter